MPRQTECAHSIYVARCADPKCNSVHIVFVDENDEPFAHAPMKLAEIPSIIEDFQRAAYEIAANKDDEP